MGIVVILVVIASFFPIPFISDVMPENGSWLGAAFACAIFAIINSTKSDEDIRDEFNRFVQQERDFISE